MKAFQIKLNGNYFNGHVDMSKVDMIIDNSGTGRAYILFIRGERFDVAPVEGDRSTYKDLVKMMGYEKSTEKQRDLQDKYGNEDD